MLIVVLLLTLALCCCPVPKGCVLENLLHISPGMPRPAVAAVVHSASEAATVLVGARVAGFASVLLGATREEVLQRAGNSTRAMVLLLLLEGREVLRLRDGSALVEPCAAPQFLFASVDELRRGSVLPACSTEVIKMTVDDSAEYCDTYAATARAKEVSMQEEKKKEENPVREHICKAFSEYFRIAEGHDDALPLSRVPYNWLHGEATLYDSVSTLLMAGCRKEYLVARVRVANSGGPPTNRFGFTKIFEYSLRVVGGALGAYSLTGDALWLNRARVAADMMLDGPFSSYAPLPARYDIVAPVGSWLGRIVRWVRKKYFWDEGARINSLAGIGSYAFELEYLSRETGDPKYAEASAAIHRALYRMANSKTPTFLHNSVFLIDDPGQAGSSDNGPLGSGADSFYEYLLKIPLFLQRSGVENLDKINAHRLQWFRRVEGRMRDHGAHVSRNGLPVDGRRYTSLLAFVPGWLALGGESAKLAETMGEACWSLYERSSFKLGPEEAMVDDRGNVTIIENTYTLRPEMIESLAVLYHTTGKDVYRQRAKTVLAAVVEQCRTAEGLFAGFDMDKKTKIDEMHSFVIAETLKYLFILLEPASSPFSAKNVFRDFVFTTEAHPLRVGLPLCIGHAVCSKEGHLLLYEKEL